MKKRKASFEELPSRHPTQDEVPVELGEGEDPNRPVRVYTDGTRRHSPRVGRCQEETR